MQSSTAQCVMCSQQDCDHDGCDGCVHCLIPDGYRSERHHAAGNSHRIPTRLMEVVTHRLHLSPGLISRSAKVYTLLGLGQRKKEQRINYFVTYIIYKL